MVKPSANYSLVLGMAKAQDGKRGLTLKVKKCPPKAKSCPNYMLGSQDGQAS